MEKKLEKITAAAVEADRQADAARAETAAERKARDRVIFCPGWRTCVRTHSNGSVLSRGGSGLQEAAIAAKKEAELVAELAALQAALAALRGDELAAAAAAEAARAKMAEEKDAELAAAVAACLAAEAHSEALAAKLRSAEERLAELSRQLVCGSGWATSGTEIPYSARW